MSVDAIVILAAGKGTRMQSSLPKVLHPLAGKPMLERVLDTVSRFDLPIVTVVGYGADLIRRQYGNRCDFAVQRSQLGTGDAARAGIEALPESVDRVLLVHGDEPLIEADTYQTMFDLQVETGARIVLLSAIVEDTRSFGRVKRDWRNQPTALVQESELGPEDTDLREVNLGAYVFDARFLREALPRLHPHPPKSEFYLTDLVAMAATEGHDAPGPGPVAAVTLDAGDECLGVNSLVHLEQASRVIYRRTNLRLMDNGVTIVDSASTFIDDAAWISPGTTIYPFTIIEGNTRIGSDCRIGPYAHIDSCRIGGHCTIQASFLEESRIENGVRIGPYAHLRPGTLIEEGAEIGNYAEIKASTVGPGAKMHHFGYVGDAEIGANVNIGAGVVTANYDGKRKHRTVVENDAFVGSGTMLRAPVRVGQGAYTGAGSVITHDVRARTVVMGVPAREQTPPGDDSGRDS